MCKLLCYLYDTTKLLANSQRCGQMRDVLSVIWQSALNAEEVSMLAVINT